MRSPILMFPLARPPFVVSVAHRSSGGGDDKGGQELSEMARIRLIVGATMSKAAYDVFDDSAEEGFDPGTVVSVKSDPNRALVGIVSIGGKKHVSVAFRGTTANANWMQNLDVPFADMAFNVAPPEFNARVGDVVGGGGGGVRGGAGGRGVGEPGVLSCATGSAMRVHEGFQGALGRLFEKDLDGKIREKLQAYPAARKHPIIVAGHSLGGAMANLLALDLLTAGYNVELMTFGAPQVGDESFADALASFGSGGLSGALAEQCSLRCSRVTNILDPVPRALSF